MIVNTLKNGSNSKHPFNLFGEEVGVGLQLENETTLF